MTTDPRLRSLLIVTVLVLTSLCPCAAQEVPSQQSTRANRPPTATTDKDKESAEIKNVDVFVLINQGPTGELYVPFDTEGKLKPANIKSDFIFPTLYFDISISPKYQESLNGNEIKDIDNRSYDLKWMSIEVKLTPKCKTGLKDEEERCSLWMLDMYPRQTAAKTTDHPVVKAASVADELITLADPFFISDAGNALNAKFGAGTKGLTVLFRNLLPPVIKTYFHARILGARTFGWAFRQDNSADQPSLLGLQRGLVFLQAGKGVESVTVSYKVLSEWNKRANDNSESKFASAQRSISFPMPVLKEDPGIDYTQLSSLQNVPAVVSMRSACQVLRLTPCTGKDEFDKIKSWLKAGTTEVVSFPEDLPADAKFSPDDVGFKRSALQRFLGIDQPKEKNDK